MDIIVSFFRDTLDGFWYFVYILVCIFFIFVLLGIVGDRKRAVIERGLKAKKARDIASGREAMIAAMESKQILDVMNDNVANSTSPGSNPTLESGVSGPVENPNLASVNNQNPNVQS